MEFINDSNYLDQHFLVDEDVINNIIKNSNLQKDDVVVEIGPGMGVLTKKIAPQVSKLIVIEKDERLKPFLEKIAGIDIIIGDAIKEKIPECTKLITSLPYSITEPFIYKIIKEKINNVYMITGSKYASSVVDQKITNISLLTNIYYDVSKLMDIPKECFKPAPRINSSFIKLSFKTNLTKTDMFFQKMYQLDDKKCKNALLESFIFVNKCTKNEAKKIISDLNIDNIIINKQFNLITNNELEILFKKVYNYLSK